MMRMIRAKELISHALGFLTQREYIVPNTRREHSPLLRNAEVGRGSQDAELTSSLEGRLETIES